jgi:hypothetical protein
MIHKYLAMLQDGARRIMAEARLNLGEAKDTVLINLVVWLRTNGPRWTLQEARTRIGESLRSLMSFINRGGRRRS